VINTSLPPILRRFQGMADYVRLSLETGSLTLTPYLGVVPCKYRYDIPLQTRFFGLHFTRRMWPCTLTTFT